jgi:hypothetical protein
MNSQGEIVYLVEATEDEMFTKESAWGSKWERQLTFKHLPADIRDECYERCLDTQRKADKADPTAALKKLIDSFFALGVRPEQLKDFLGVANLEALTPADIQELRLVYSAIKEVDTNWREVMELRNEQRGEKGQQQTSKAADKVKEAAARKASKAHSGPAKESETTSQNTSNSTPSQDTGKTAEKDKPTEDTASEDSPEAGDNGNLW